ncbi:ABC transporter ATP-binding protein [Vineibacter terrae]|uniref:ABC transporter ATP-binding protein n=1 Tax=Vineibacter terrae TaxID=2586908 RepID=A0A5C8PA82_9HYPH|nr:ABC transporter ATP-binding protein [Vineibacter terrae]TXL69919.1 ABC transporter ATP-binding protein [Vineibacter terrae]
MTTTDLLSVQGLAAGYGGALAVRGLDFAVAPGTIAVLVGANGAGKTTTVQVIAGAIRPSGGTIRFDGETVTGLDCPAMVDRGITLVPEGRLIFARMTVEENLLMGALNRRAAANLARNLDRVFALFPRLAQRRGQLGGSMSGGEQQMLAIARGLMAEPRLMILDEPSLGLAPKVVAETFGLIRQLNAEGITILLVEQNVRQSLQLADRAFVIEKGRVVLSGAGPTLLDDPFVKTAFLGL